MSLTLRTNKWASRVIIILHLVIWNAIGIVLLQKGVSTLRKRMLETGHVIQTNSSISLSIESTVTSIKRAENEYNVALVPTQQQLTDQNQKLIIQIESPRNDRNNPGSNVIRNELEIALEEQRSTTTLFLSDPFGENSATDGPNLRVKNRIDHPEIKISRTARDRENVLDKKISKDIRVEENVTRSISESKEEEETHDSKGKNNVNSVENVSRELKFLFTRDQSTGHQWINNSLRRSNNSRIKFSNNGGAATAAIAMVAIGAIMLLVGPIVIILRILDERRQARKLHALSVAAREDLPPTYEQAVFLSEAPRYSSLALNDDTPVSPPPSPTFGFPNPTIKPHST